MSYGTRNASSSVFNLTFIGIFDFVFHLVELSRGLLLLNLPYRTVPGIYCWRFHVAGLFLFTIIIFNIGTLVINIIYFVLLDRLMMAAVQRRTGPYNVGYFGLLQSMDDGLKLVKNEVIIPKKSSCILFLVVPNLFFYCSLILWSIIPLEGFCYNIYNLVLNILR